MKTKIKMFYGIAITGIAIVAMSINASAQNPFYVGSGDIYYNNGDVGIGTSSPTDLLHVKNGGLLIESSTGTGSDATLSLKTSNTSTVWNISLDEDQNDQISYNVDGYRPYELYKSGVMKIKSSSGSASDARLQLLSSESSVYWSLGNDDSHNDDFYIHAPGLSVSTLVLTTSGNVGIGENDPNATLLVNGHQGGLNSANFRVKHDGTNTNLNGAEFQALSNHDGLISGNDWTALYAKQGNASKAAYFDGDVFIDGKIGIGEPNPTHTLSLSNNGQRMNLLSGTNSSGYTLNVGVNDDGVNFYNNSSNRGFNFKNPNGTLVTISKTGKVGIGTDQFSGNGNYNLFVINGIRTEEVLVDVCDVNGWCDYVFEDDYALMPLSEVEQYIKAKKHLPEIPSADEVVENGVKLKEMNALLLKKVEELTLYTIQQQNEIDEIKSIILNQAP